MDLSRRTAWLVLAMLQRPDGHRQLVEFKVWCYQASDGSEQFLWEFRRLLDCVDLVPPSMYLHQWVRKNRPAWDALWAEHGLDSQAVLVPSSKAEQSVARRDERLVNDSPLVRSEWSITTRAALTLFLHMAAGARKVAHRRSCSLLLEAFVSALVPLSFAGELQRMMRNDEVVASCQIDSVAGTNSWKGIRVTVKLTIQNRAAKVDVEPNATSLVIKQLKEPLRDRKKTKNIKHSGNLTKQQIFDICRQIRYKSLSKEFKGTVKEVLGTCNAVGCTVEGMKPMALQQAIDNDEFECPES